MDATVDALAFLIPSVVICLAIVRAWQFFKTLIGGHDL